MVLWIEETQCPAVLQDQGWSICNEGPSAHLAHSHVSSSKN